MTDSILTLIATALGGVNLLQFLYLRQIKREKNAHASQAETCAARARMDLHHDGTNQMIEEIDTMRKKLVELNGIIIQKIDECSELKAQVIYLKDKACFREGCVRRINKQNDEKNNGLFNTVDRC